MDAPVPVRELQASVSAAACSLASQSLVCCSPTQGVVVLAPCAGRLPPRSRIWSWVFAVSWF